MASNHRRAWLLGRYGWGPWTQLVAAARTQHAQADAQADAMCLARTWRRWSEAYGTSKGEGPMGLGWLRAAWRLRLFPPLLLFLSFWTVFRCSLVAFHWRSAG